MRKSILPLLLILSFQIVAVAQTTASSVSYSVAARGGQIIETLGGAEPVIVGYARVQPSVSTVPAGVAIFGLRLNGILVTEAGVPAVTPILSGRTFAEVGGAINTGIAFANPNSNAVVITFTFTDQNGNDFGRRSLTLGPREQIARFLSEDPFGARIQFTGTFSFSSTEPVAVVALRGLTNERGEFLIATQPVTPIPSSFNGSVVTISHFADGGGWKMELVLVNPSEETLTGSVQFFSEGSSTVSGAAIMINVNGLVAASFDYTIRPHASVKLTTMSSSSAVVQVGSIRITPTPGIRGPSSFAVFSLATAGVTVAQAAVPAETPGPAFRMYAEATSSSASPASIQTGIAIGNTSSTPATVNFELTTLSGTSVGLSAAVVVPAFGHVSKFLNELFPTLDLPFRGILRINGGSSIIAVSGLRTRFNERGDFMITMTPASNEIAQATTADVFFPHIVDRGGYTTQFVLFSGVTGQTSFGSISFVGQSGQALNLTVQ